MVTDSRDRDVHDPPPHFAQPGSLEFDFALKWRELQLAHKAESDQLAELHRQASTGRRAACPGVACPCPRD